MILFKVFAFVHKALTQESSNADLLVAFVVLICFFGFLYAVLSEITQLSLLHIPFLSKNPPLYPSSSKYFVKLGGKGDAMPFQWKYPCLIVDGARFNMKRSFQKKGKTIKVLLSSGTEIEFIPI